MRVHKQPFDHWIRRAEHDVGAVFDPVGKQGKGVIALQKALQRAGSIQVDCCLYPNGRHEMINELNKKQVIADLMDWLNKQNLSLQMIKDNT